MLANTLACCAGAVSQAASSAASFGCPPALGTVRNAPPQLPAAGAWAMSHCPAAPSPELALMMPVIQDGQTTVANLDR